jgi:eukaryotic-like serine/threonine-protein kinase
MPHVEPLHADDPSHVGRYRLSGRIAGMPGASPVYLARAVDGSDMMITLLDGDWTADPAERDRFTAEANAAAMVAPFCAARILGAGFDGKQAFLVSEYVPGPSLRELVTEEGPWEGRDLEALAIGTATGLAAIHQAGLVHGGFGPEYVVLSPDGPRVVEFGITPPYGSATPANDMRAWARALLFAAAGRPPDAAYDDLELLPGPLRALATRCLSWGPGDQPTARSAVIELLGDGDPPAGVLAEGARRAVPAGAPPIPQNGPQPPGQGRTRRAVTLWWAVGVAVCIVAIALVIHVLQNKSDQASTPSSASKVASPHPTAKPSAKPTRAATIPASLAGTWSGQVSQDSSSGTFSVSVDVSLTSGATAGSVHYSGPFTCSDDLNLVSDTFGTLTLDQATVKGPCQRGVVTLTPGSGTTLQFSFKGKGAPAATGTLTKAT